VTELQVDDCSCRFTPTPFEKHLIGGAAVKALVRPVARVPKDVTVERLVNPGYGHKEKPSAGIRRTTPLNGSAISNG
jgi:hypothetical protein